MASSGVITRTKKRLVRTTWYSSSGSSYSASGKSMSGATFLARASFVLFRRICRPRAEITWSRASFISREVSSAR